MVRKLIAIVALTGGLALAGCNTISGIGKDVGSVGDSVSDCAEGTTC
jgi:predicted small secreted protein